MPARPSLFLCALLCDDFYGSIVFDNDVRFDHSLIFDLFVFDNGLIFDDYRRIFYHGVFGIRGFTGQSVATCEQECSNDREYVLHEMLGKKENGRSVTI